MLGKQFKLSLIRCLQAKQWHYTEKENKERFTLQLSIYLAALHSTFASQCYNVHAKFDQTAGNHAAVVLADAATSALTQPV